MSIIGRLSSGPSRLCGATFEGAERLQVVRNMTPGAHSTRHCGGRQASLDGELDYFIDRGFCSS